ncbi:MAG: TraB/GumN family protein [Chitinophagaceae bacterium]|nr:TraB/GumN family protein [Chitinophagaceae bacterium]
MRIYLSILISTFLLSCKGQNNPSLKVNKDDNTLLWQVTGNGLKSPSYLYGTFHLMCKNDILISEQLKLALKQSNTIYLELDMDDPATLMGGLLLMNMTDGKKLKDLYTEEEYVRVENFFQDSLRTPISFMQSMKPLFLMSLLYPKMMPCKNISGVEEAIMKLAKENKKEVKGLETMAFQASVFDSIPYKEQAKELLNSIDSMEYNKNELYAMMNAYKNQRLDELEKSLKKSELTSGDNESILITKRNRNWVQQLNAIMKKESVFVAVGAGHLPGGEGVINLLIKEGYTVKPLYNK